MLIEPAQKQVIFNGGRATLLRAVEEKNALNCDFPGAEESRNFKYAMVNIY